MVIIYLTEMSKYTSCMQIEVPKRKENGYITNLISTFKQTETACL